ncbi:MAG: dienelactone hydrolase family protein [Natronomonas sp.]
MSETVVVPSDREVDATLDNPDSDSSSSSACVVACPPHPQMGGNRSDQRLRAVSDKLTASGVACLRFDYGDWDGGHGELGDAKDAFEWARNRYERVGIFGYSFGGCIALLAAAETDPVAVAALAPASTLGEGLDAVAAIDAIQAPVRIVYGERDDTANWEPLVERARMVGVDVVGVGTDHFFIGQAAKIGSLAGGFLVDEFVQNR